MNRAAAINPPASLTRPSPAAATVIVPTTTTAIRPATRAPSGRAARGSGAQAKQPHATSTCRCEVKAAGPRCLPHQRRRHQWRRPGPQGPGLLLGARRTSHARLLVGPLQLGGVPPQAHGRVHPQCQTESGERPFGRSSRTVGTPPLARGNPVYAGKRPCACNLSIGPGPPAVTHAPALHPFSPPRTPPPARTPSPPATRTPDACAPPARPALDSAMPKAATRDTVVPAGTASTGLSGDGATQLNGITTSTTLLVHARSRPHV